MGSGYGHDQLYESVMITALQNLGLQAALYFIDIIGVEYRDRLAGITVEGQINVLCTHIGAAVVLAR